MLTLTKLEDRVEVRSGQSLVTSYVHAPSWSKPFLYPVIGPGGHMVTAQEPEDHPHHRSIWVAHGNVNGADCWSEQQGHGRVIHQEFLRLDAGEAYAELAAKNLWTARDAKPVLGELRGIRIWNPRSDTVMIDLSVGLTAAHGPVLFEDTKEAGLASIRVASSMEVEEGGRLENSAGGVNEAEVWGRRSLWCDYSGKVEGEHLGVAIFDHPSNPRHPTYWHARDYGLMTANCFGISAFTKDPSLSGKLLLAEGESLTFNYRVYVHKGDARQGMVQSAYERYAQSPLWRLTD